MLIAVRGRAVGVRGGAPQRRYHPLSLRLPLSPQAAAAARGGTWQRSRSARDVRQLSVLAVRVLRRHVHDSVRRSHHCFLLPVQVLLRLSQDVRGQVGRPLQRPQQSTPPPVEGARAYSSAAALRFCAQGRLDAIYL